jgi:hypothetical protein
MIEAGHSQMKEKELPTQKRFASVPQVDVPKGRDGKHRMIIDVLLDSIAALKDGSALKIPLADLPDTKDNIRSAQSRATRQHGIEIATSSDHDHLYVWKPQAE